MFLKVFAALFLMGAATIAVDYCDTFYACGDTANIGCTYSCFLNGGWGPNCTSPTIFDMNSTYQQALVDVHNYYRNQIAIGNVTHFEPAVRMAKMRWDDDLAALAEVNVRRCLVEHDGCHSTTKYQMTGQNLDLYMVGSVDWNRQLTPEQVATNAKSWYNEQLNMGDYGWMKTIQGLGSVSNSTGREIGHFTQWVQGKAEAIGCAASFFLNDYAGSVWSAWYLTCNYSWGNLSGDPVYANGTTASNCTTGPDSTYPGLCSENESYPANFSQYYLDYQRYGVYN